MSDAAKPPDVKGTPPRERPTPLDGRVSTQMSRMPRSGSGPELRLRRALFTAGLRFHVQRKDLPGRPDIVLTRARIAIFVDGCFWHACPEHGTYPKNNAEWWREKLAANLERDRCKDELLRDAGWLPVHVWEHEDPQSAATRVVDLWRERTGRPSTSS